MNSLLNIFWLGIKEIRSLMSDTVMVAFVVYAFTLTIYVQATGTSSEVNNASIAFVDEDESALSKELFNAFYPPRFKFPDLISSGAMQDAMDKGLYMFVVAIPPRLERDLRAGRNPDIQVNIDATAMQQAGIGAGYIRNILTDRISAFLKRTDKNEDMPIRIVIRKMFNRNAVSSWFKSVVAIINQISLLTVIAARCDPRARARHAGAFAGHAAHRLRDRDGQGANSLVILIATAASLFLVVEMAPGTVRWLGRCGSPVSCSICSSLRRWGYSRYGLPVDGAVRVTDHPGHRRADAVSGSRRSKASRRLRPHLFTRRHGIL